jgi:hypothetical protein
MFDIIPLPLAPDVVAPPMLPQLLSLGSDAAGCPFPLPPTLIYATAATLIVHGPSSAESAMYVTRSQHRFHEIWVVVVYFYSESFGLCSC